MTEVERFDVIVVLGTPNSPTGELSGIAKDRLKKAAALLERRPGARLLLTGGFGEHFNTSDEPHFRYGRRFLLDLGVPVERLVPDGIPSSSTIEDADLARAYLERSLPCSVTVVTSDFHLARARGEFERAFAPHPIEFVGASDSGGAAAEQSAPPARPINHREQEGGGGEPDA